MMSEICTRIAHDDITEAYDALDSLLSTHGSHLTGDVLAELHRAKDSLFRARLLTDVAAHAAPLGDDAP